MNRALAVVVVLALAACGSTTGAKLAALRVSMTAANTAAYAYVTRPTCGTIAAGLPCADLGIVEKIGTASAAADKAMNAVDIAADSDSIGKAQAAVEGLRNIVQVVTTGETK